MKNDDKVRWKLEWKRRKCEQTVIFSKCSEKLQYIFDLPFQD